MKYTREEVLKGAFNEFMLRGYHGTSISDLQRRLNISRGGLYRHCKNKEDLFRAVIDEYVFSSFDRIMNDDDPQIKVPEMIRLMRMRQEQVIDTLIKAGVTYHSFLDFTGLLIQAARYYPGFMQRFRKVQLQIDARWRTALENSIVAGEVKKDADVNIVSKLFSNICLNDNRNQRLQTNDFAEMLVEDAKERNKTLLYLYNLIKQ